MTTQTTASARSLRNLYLVRTAFQLVWAGVLLAPSTPAPGVGVLLILYPLWDVACTLYDIKNSGAGAGPMQSFNVVLGLLTSAAIGLTIFHQPQYAVAAFGVWALAAGLLQLGVGMARRKALGGQWAMILSGAQSALAGIFFVLAGLGDKKHPKDLGGYAVFGAIYFLIAAVLLSRKIARAAEVGSLEA